MQPQSNQPEPRPEPIPSNPPWCPTPLAEVAAMARVEEDVGAAEPRPARPAPVAAAPTAAMVVMAASVGGR